MEEDRDDPGVAVLSPAPAATDTAELPENYRFMAIGGYSDAGGVLRSTELFDVGAQSWSAGPPMVLPRYGHGVAVWFPPFADALNPRVSAFVPPFYGRTKHVVRAAARAAGLSALLTTRARRSLRWAATRAPTTASRTRWSGCGSTRTAGRWSGTARFRSQPAALRPSAPQKSRGSGRPRPRE